MNRQTRRPTPALPAPRKRFGQHFLRDERVLDAIVEALGPIHDRTVIEIGPGRGILTDRLIERAGRVIAIEIDRDLVTHLRDRYADRPNIEIVEADVLKISLAELAGGPYVLAGNVPYYITTPILFHALVPPRADRSVYLVQKEVADRLSASPGTREYGALTVNVAAVARAETLFKVAAGSFSPPPKVESAVVRITPHAEALVRPEEERPFRLLVQSAFGMRRKQMRRVLRSIYNLDVEHADALLDRAGIDGEVRPETLSPEEFARLLRAVAG